VNECPLVLVWIKHFCRSQSLLSIQSTHNVDLLKCFVNTQNYCMVLAYFKQYFGFNFILFCWVRIAQSVQWWTTGWRARFWFLPRARISLLYSSQTSSGAHLASYPMGTSTISPGVMQTKHDADHSPPSSTKVKNGGAIPLFPPMPSWHSD
jgi:hypothetical protein